jgi:hypothetical protein
MKRFCHNLHQVRSKVEKLESQFFLQILEDIKPKDINRIAKIGQDHIRHDAAGITARNKHLKTCYLTS